MKSIFLICLVTLSSCSYNLSISKDLYSTAEFVLDSYKINQGKDAILELQGESIEPFDENLLEKYEDAIDEGDLLSLCLRKNINEVIHIQQKVVNGKISLPKIHNVKVATLTLQKAKEIIQKKLTDYLSVDISYEDRAYKKIDILGMVQKSNILIDGPKTLYDILIECKLPSDANLFKSYFIRDNKILFIDFVKLIKKGDMSQNIVMKGGDKIYIADPTESTIMVVGKVKKEKVINFGDGVMPLKQAITEAGGIAFIGNNPYIQVIRGGCICPKIYILNWEHVITLPNNSLLVMDGDMIYVTSTPIYKAKIK